MGGEPKRKKKTQNQKSSGHEGNFKRRRSWLISFSNWVSHPGPHKAKNLSVPAGFEEELPRLSSKRIKKKLGQLPRVLQEEKEENTHTHFFSEATIALVPNQIK